MKSEKNDRKNYRRVTEILYPFSGLDKIPPHFVEAAGIRGSKVHKICEGIIEGLGEHGIEEELKGYIESFKKWWGEGHDVVAMEKRFWNKKHRLTGQVDLIIRRDNKLIIIDFKTSSKPSKTWAAQGAAYAFLAKKAKFKIDSIEFIHLNKLGKEPKVYCYPVDDNFFLSILRVSDYFWSKGKDD